MQLPATSPVVVKKGNVSIKIYRGTNTKKTGKGDRTYAEFKVVYYGLAGERRSRTFSSYSDILGHAGTVTGMLSKGDAETLMLTSNDRLVYLRATEAIR